MTFELLEYEIIFLHWPSFKGNFCVYKTVQICFI